MRVRGLVGDQCGFNSKGGSRRVQVGAMIRRGMALGHRWWDS